MSSEVLVLKWNMA